MVLFVKASIRTLTLVLAVLCVWQPLVFKREFSALLVSSALFLFVKLRSWGLL